MSFIEELQKIIEGYLPGEESLKRNLIAIYLFGSFAKNMEKPLSDIDLAFVFFDDFYRDDPFIALQKAEMLCLDINNKTHKSADVVVLNSTSLTFAFHVIREAICVYEKCAAERILYEIGVDNKYQDFAPFIKELRDIKRKSLLGSN